MKAILALLVVVVVACGGPEMEPRAARSSSGRIPIPPATCSGTPGDFPPGAVGCACSLDSECACGLLCSSPHVDDACMHDGRGQGSCYDPCAGGTCTR